jgi:formate dehydrogenase iron-sulfur subunit
MMACPYGIPRYDWDKQVPYVKKCILCYDKIAEGMQPACTSVCPEGATIFGERSELLKIARSRIKTDPDKYIDHIWGEHEIGGTSVLYISDIDLGFLSYQSKLGTEPLPETTAPAMNSIPYAFVGMGGLMLGINWIIKRRMENAKPDSNSEDEKNE